MRIKIKLKIKIKVKIEVKIKITIKMKGFEDRKRFHDMIGMLCTTMMRRFLLRYSTFCKEPSSLCSPRHIPQFSQIYSRNEPGRIKVQVVNVRRRTCCIHW